ncbi:peptidoglycan DD-metalloendopeptidase family protein [Herpetosiphon gulosus]
MRERLRHFIQDSGQIQRTWANIRDTMGAVAAKAAMDTAQRFAGHYAQKFSAGTVFNETMSGQAAYKQRVISIDAEARAVKALGAEYAQFRREYMATRSAYGFSGNQVQALASMNAQTLGRANISQLPDAMKVQQGFARGYGMDAVASGQLFNQAARAGITTGGGDTNPRDFAALIADAVSQGRMGGREEEVMQSLTTLSQSINQQRVDVAGTSQAASMLAMMNATNIRGLQGNQGASLLGQVNSAIQNPNGDVGNLHMYQALTGGRGGMRLGQYEYLKEEGLTGVGATGKTNFQALMEYNAQQSKGMDKYSGLMLQSKSLGVSMHQAEALTNTFMQGGKFNSMAMGNLQTKLGADLTKVDPSTWAMLAELSNGGDVGAIAKEFNQLTDGKVTASTTMDRDALFKQIADYGKQNIAMSEGQRREKIDNDIALAAENAGAKLYELEKASDQLKAKFMEIAGGAPGIAGGLLPTFLASAGGSLLPAAGQWALGKGGGGLLSGLKGLFGGGAGGAATTGGATGTSVAATGGSGILSGVGAFAGGLAMAGGSVVGASEFSHGVLDTERFLGGYHRSAIGQGASRLFSGDVGLGELASAGKTVITSPVGVLGGLGGGLTNLITGNGSFKEGYNNTFDDLMGAIGVESDGQRQREAQRAYEQEQRRIQRDLSHAFVDTFKTVLKDRESELSQSVLGGIKKGLGALPAGGILGSALNNLTGGQLSPAASGNLPADVQSPAGSGMSGAVNSMVSGGKIISGWGDARPNGRSHQGIDISGNAGQAIRAPSDGEVTYSGWNELGGYYVQYKDNEGRQHYFAHMQDKPTLAAGDKIKAGQSIGRVGRTGYGKQEGTLLPESIPTHLHYQVSKPDGKTWVDPKQELGHWQAPTQPSSKPSIAASGGMGGTGGTGQTSSKAIDSVLSGTGMEGQGSTIQALSQKYGVPAELALAMWRKEAEFAKPDSIAGRQNNPGNMIYTGKWGDKQSNNRFAQFDTMEQGMEAWFKLMSSDLYKPFIDKGDYAGLLNKYAPPSENDTGLYHKQLLQWMQDYQGKIKSSAGGEWSTQNRLYELHKDETVIPAPIARPMRKFFEQISTNDNYLTPANPATRNAAAAAALRISIDPISVVVNGQPQTVKATGKWEPFEGINAFAIA